jgi:hypothetical protein
VERSGLIYLYAVVPEQGAYQAILDRLKGVDDTSLEAIAEDRLVALVSVVDAATWNAEALDQHVRDLDWLAPRATRHQEVLAVLHAMGNSMLPLPFATLYQHPDHVHALLRIRQDDFVQALGQLKDAEEWTLKVAQDPATFEQHVARFSPAFAAAAEQSRVAPPGKAYLLRKQLETLRRSEASRAMARQGDEIEQRVRSLAEDVIREPITRQARNAPSATNETAVKVVLKLALLLRTPQRDDIQQRLAELAEEYGTYGYVFELTGPWPPYSFARLHPEQSDG